MPVVDGAFLKQYRAAELDWSPAKAAGLLDISRGYLKEVEGGRENPSERLVGRICRTYGLDRDCFVLDSGGRKHPDEGPTQPVGPKAPPRRQEKEQERKGPKRAAAVGA